MTGLFRRISGAPSHVSQSRRTTPLAPFSPLISMPTPAMGWLPVSGTRHDRLTSAPGAAFYRLATDDLLSVLFVIMPRVEPQRHLIGIGPRQL